MTESHNPTGRDRLTPVQSDEKPFYDGSSLAGEDPADTDPKMEPCDFTRTTTRGRVLQVLIDSYSQIS